jgi:hypothetical protein
MTQPTDWKAVPNPTTVDPIPGTNPTVKPPPAGTLTPDEAAAANSRAVATEALWAAQIPWRSIFEVMDWVQKHPEWIEMSKSGRINFTPGIVP